MALSFFAYPLTAMLDDKGRGKVAVKGRDTSEADDSEVKPG